MLIRFLIDVVFGVVDVVVVVVFLLGRHLSALSTMFVRLRCVWAFACFALVCHLAVHSVVIVCAGDICLLFKLLLKF